MRYSRLMTDDTTQRLDLDLGRAIRQAPNLDALCAALNAAREAGINVPALGVDLSTLPVYDLARPENTLGVFSWDETRELVYGSTGWGLRCR